MNAKLTAQIVATVGNYATITHAIKGALRYDEPVITLCGLTATGYESFMSGRELDVTCRNCQRIAKPVVRQRWIMYSFVGIPGETSGRVTCHESLEWAKWSFKRFSENTYSYEQAYATLYPYTDADWREAREFEHTGCPLDSLTKLLEFGPRGAIRVVRA